MNMLKIKNNKLFKIYVVFLITLLISFMQVSFLSNVSYASEEITLTFSDDGIEETVAGERI